MASFAKAERDVAAQRVRRQARTAAGVCFVHTDRPAVTKTMCAECRERMNGYHTARKLESATTCIRGAHPNDQPERSSICTDCTEGMRIYHNKPKLLRYFRDYQRRRRKRARLTSK